MRFITRLENWVKQNQIAWNEIRSQEQWIKQIRKQRGLKGKELAQLMSLSAARISVMEKEEANGALTLKMMQRAADALDCDFAYVFIPKTALQQNSEAEKPKIRL